jgi:hypothetical protein
MTIARADGFVSVHALDAVRDHLRAAAGADSVLAAVATWDRCSALRDTLRAEGHQAHRRPTEARQAHHAAVVDALLQGRFPDDESVWLEVEQADAQLDLAKARVAAAGVAVNRAGTALYSALSRSWAVLLPYVAQHRPQRPVGLDVLASAFRWPALHHPPGVETQSDPPSLHFSQWWPLSFEPLDPRRQRAERAEWNEFGWTELAAGRFSAEGDTITLERQWTPPRFSSTSEDGVRQIRQPVVIVTPERVAEHERQLTMRR